MSFRGALRGEAGAGTVLAIGLGLVVMAACVFVVLLGQALAASSRAATAADLAALAAADAERGLRPGVPCSLAEETARLNGAELVACVVDSDAGTVRVQVTVGPEALWGPAMGRARAGPPP